MTDPVRRPLLGRRPGRWSLSVALGLLSLLYPSAHAEVWGYVDDRGTAHFAAERLDARYELFYRGHDSFDSRTDLPASAAGGTPRPMAAPASASRLLAYFEVTPGYQSIQHHLREAAQTHGLDYELLKALIATESGFDRTAVSPKGAVGLMQLMPATAERFGVAADARRSVAQKLTDPGTNIRAGARYLGELMKLFPGQLELVLAAYNAGEGAVQRAGNRVPNYRETQNYVQTVLQLHALLKPAAAVRSAQRVTRVRMALGGGAAMPGRANMIPPTGAPALTAVALTEQE